MSKMRQGKSTLEAWRSTEDLVSRNGSRSHDQMSIEGDWRQEEVNQCKRGEEQHQ